MMSVNDRTAVDFTLSEGRLHDAPQGRLLMETVGKLKTIIPLVMDRAYEDDLMRFIAHTLNFKPVVPPKSNRKNPWAYDKELYKRRNEIERLFRLLDGFRRVFVRFEKLDKMYMGFVKLALIYVAIK
jgi:transposase